MRRIRAAAAVFAAAGAMVFATPRTAAAQQPRTPDRPATEGVERVIHDYSGEGDASSLELNPALLSTLAGLDLTLLGYRALADFTRGTGFGGFAAANLGFGLALGLGVQFVQPGLRGNTFDAASAQNPDMTKLSFGMSGGLGTRGSFGVAIHGVRAGGRWLSQPDLDLGTMIRIRNYGSVGLAARIAPIDLRGDSLPSEFALVAEVGIRPLGTRTLELAGGLKARLLQREFGGDLDNLGGDGLLPRGRIALRWQGWALVGEVEQVRTTVLDPQNLAPLRDQKAVRGAVGLEASWDFATLGVGVHAGISDEVDGIGFKARASSKPKGRVFWPRRVDAERLELKDIDDETSLVAMLEQIERAEAGGKRTILVVDARGTKAGWGSLHEIRQALIRVRNAGGHVFAYLETATLPDYYVASMAEKIYMHPAGALETYGISQSQLYFKAALDRIGVNAEVMRIDEYKSAGEILTGNGPSKADREQREAILGDVYEQLVYDIGRGRKLAETKVRALFDDAPYGAKKADALGLVDDVVFRDELLGKLSSELGVDVAFASFPDARPQPNTWSDPPYVAVVLVEDTIIDGDSRWIPFLDLLFTGGDTIAQTLREVREDPACKGIVLRVNSPGGSALASDVMWREVERTHDAHKKDPRFSPPIVVSMGDLAASGGYYVAMGTDTVFADPMTITGSIGVISLHLDISGLLRILGISTTTFKQGKNPDIDSIYKPYNDDQRARVEKSMRRTYDLFRSRVAKGRGLTMKKVDELGRGHVYSGRRALALGLVDRLGGLREAVEDIRTKARVRSRTRLHLRVLPKKKRLLDLILEQVGNPLRRDGGALVRGARRRQRGAIAKQRRAVLPLALNEALARIPLSLLYLPQGRAQAIAPGLVTLR